MMDKETQERITKALEEQGVDIEMMQRMTHKIGVMTAVRNLSGSKDFDKLSVELSRIKDNILPPEEMKEIIEKYYDGLVEEGMIEKSGQLAPEAVHVVLEHEEVINQGDATEEKHTERGVQHWKKGSIVTAADGATFSDIRINKGDTGVIVHDESLRVVTDPTEVNDLILVIWDKDINKKPRTWYIAYAEVTGTSKKYDKNNYSYHFEKVRKEHEQAKEFAQKMINNKDLLSEEDTELMNKAVAAQAGIYKMSKEEERKVKDLRKKLNLL